MWTAEYAITMIHVLTLRAGPQPTANYIIESLCCADGPVLGCYLLRLFN